MRALEVFRPRPVAASLRGQLIGALRRSAIFCLLLAAPVVGFYSLAGVDFGVGRMDYAPGAPVVVDEGPSSLVERILARHDCWVGEAPEGVVYPGGVVLAEVGGGPRFYSSDAIVGGALDHLFTSPDPTIVAVYGFCR